MLTLVIHRETLCAPQRLVLSLCHRDCISESSGLVGCLRLNWVRVSFMENLGLLKWRRKAIIKTRQKEHPLVSSWTGKETGMLEACSLALLCWQMGRQVPMVQSRTYSGGKHMVLEERVKWGVSVCVHQENRDISLIDFKEAESIMSKYDSNFWGSLLTFHG